MSLAARAAAMLVLSDLDLDVVGTLATRLIFAPLLVHLIRLIVVALEADQALETHVVKSSVFS